MWSTIQQGQYGNQALEMVTQGYKYSNDIKGGICVFFFDLTIHVRRPIEPHREELTTIITHKQHIDQQLMIGFIIDYSTFLSN